MTDHGPLERHEFLRDAERDLGVPLRYPTRPTGTKAVPAIPEPPAASPPLGRAARWLVATGAVLLVGVLLSRVVATRADPLPPAAVGTWRTADARYADRQLRLTPDSLHLRLGAAGPDVAYAIVGLRTRPHGGGVHVRLAYAADDAADEALQFDFIVESAPQPTLRFLQPSDLVWTSATGAP
jgi:hypothetical protein